MTQVIKILPEHLVNKIAAGEVIQRPASAVKELVENAIDARARTITVMVKEGGKSFIQVTDDGIGMVREDAEIAINRHATSKIYSYDDLANIRTLGFRGEALASIAAVSRFELKTKHETSAVGVKVSIDGGRLIRVEEEAHTRGTSVVLKNLFYNTPGRRNFLKTDPTEYRHVYDVLQRAALSHPEIAFKFISDGESVLNLRACSRTERVREIFGDKISDFLISFEEERQFIKLSGFLGRPLFGRKGRTEQFIFLNDRYVINRNINHAVYKAYEQMLEKGSFPLFIIYLKVEPGKVDVNVHPSKMEVKFDDEGEIYRSVFGSVRKALSAHDLFPAVGIVKENGRGRKQTTAGYFMRQREPWKDLYRTEVTDGSVITARSDIKFNSDDINNLSEKSQAEPFRDENKIMELSAQDEGNKVLQIHNKYIVIPAADGIMIVDQHAAHERIIYERVIKRLNEGNSRSQQLLFPHTAEMTPGDAALIKQILPLLERLGFTLKLFGQSTVIMDGVPNDIRPGDENRILQDIIDIYKEEGENIKMEPRERLAKSFSCRTAVKSGDPLKSEEAKSLLDQLFGCEIPFVCPHGRPVIVRLSLNELDRRFGRTS